MDIFTRLIKRWPKVGDKVWWAPKGLLCQVVSVDRSANVFTFTGGETVILASGRSVPRWVVSASVYGDSSGTSAADGYWTVGQGPLPKTDRAGQVIFPDPARGLVFASKDSKAGSS